jgi:hypothetical protein
MLMRSLHSSLQAIKNWPVARKLWVIYGLNVGVVGVACGILVTETLPHIELARSEQAGNAYIGAVAKVVQALPVPLGRDSAVQLRGTKHRLRHPHCAMRTLNLCWHGRVCRTSGRCPSSTMPRSVRLRET